MSQTDSEYRFQGVTDLVYCPKCNPKGKDKFTFVGWNHIPHADRNILETIYECTNADCEYTWNVSKVSVISLCLYCAAYA